MKFFEKLKTEKEIRNTYKKLVKTYHPDVYGDKGNEIMKEIHNQLEKALKNVGKDLYQACDKEETAKTRARKEKIAKELNKKYGAFAYQYLHTYYWLNGLRPANHRNPLTRHNFTGWNVWQLELKMLLEGYNSSEWSTFAQYSNNDNSIIKGQKGCYITLAIVSKSKDKEDGEKEETKEKVYYKGYTVFNIEQTNKGKKQNTHKHITEVKAIEKITRQTTLDLWQEKDKTVA